MKHQEIIYQNIFLQNSFEIFRKFALKYCIKKAISHVGSWNSIVAIRNSYLLSGKKWRAFHPRNFTNLERKSPRSVSTKISHGSECVRVLKKKKILLSNFPGVRWKNILSSQKFLYIYIYRGKYIALTLYRNTLTNTVPSYVEFYIPVYQIIPIYIYIQVVTVG